MARRYWILAAAIVLAAVIIVGGLLWLNGRNRACERWESQMHTWARLQGQALNYPTYTTLLESIAERSGYYGGRGEPKVYRPSGC